MIKQKRTALMTSESTKMITVSLPIGRQKFGVTKVELLTAIKKAGSSIVEKVQAVLRKTKK